jgi:tRNA A37 methylthiotransferase MiaB
MKPMKKVYLETFGCQMNVSDSERVATLLESEGFEITSIENSADVVLLNTCSVREKAEHKLYTRVGQIRNSKDKKTVVGVMGCVAQLEGETLFKRAPGIDFVLGTKALGRVSSAIEKAFDGEKNIHDLGEPRRARRAVRLDGQRLAETLAVRRLRADHRGLQQILHLLHRPFFQRAREKPRARRDRPSGYGSQRERF